MQSVHVETEHKTFRHFLQLYLYYTLILLAESDIIYMYKIKCGRGAEISRPTVSYNKTR